MTIDHEKLLAIIASAGTLPLGDVLSYGDQDDLMNAVGPLVAESRAYLNDLRISNDVGHEWANRAQDRAAALIDCQDRFDTIYKIAAGGDVRREAASGLAVIAKTGVSR